jgi:hypothetical protein
MPALLRARMPQRAVTADIGTLGRARRYRRAMIQMARDAPASIACGRSGLPLLAICPNGHRRTVPLRLLKTSECDRTPLYGRPFKCRECGSREVATLYAIETQAELDELRQEPLSPRPTLPHSTHRPPNPDADLL